MTQAFEGIRIVDFTQGVAGPMTTMLFADYGADVIKVEPPGGDRMASHPGYLCWNRNKRRLGLDLHTYDGLHAARSLIATAAVAVFDSHPGELERLGLDGTTLVAANPGLLHVWMPPYAPAGRWSQLPMDELLRTAVTGVAHLQFSFEDQPVALVTPQVSYAHATIAANAIAAGLWERSKSGLGQALTVSGLHAVASVEGGGAISAGGLVRLARTSRGGAHYGLYRCADGEWFFLGCLTAPFFLKALAALDLEEILTWEGVDGELTNIMRDPELVDRTRAALEAKLATAPRSHWLDLLSAAGVPLGPVGQREQWFRDETVAANGMRLVMEHPSHGRVELPGIPVKLEDTPGSVRHFLEETTLAEALEVPAPIPTKPSSGIPPRGRPLEGVRVLDLGAFIAGTFAPTVLANYGADVIKVEPAGGDPFRPYGLLFVGHNLGKRSLAMDLKHPDGRAAFESIVRQSDVVLDNFRMGVRERLGIDYATLSAINPRIITCSVTGYGPRGPLAAGPGFDPLLQARSGMMAAQGGADEPVFHQIAVNDTATAMMAAFGIQAALHARERTGRGQEVHTSLAAQTILFQSGELTRYEGRAPSPTGGRDFLGLTALQRFYPCADGWLAVSCHEAGQFQQLAVALGHPEWAGRMVAERALSEPSDGTLATQIAEVFAALPKSDAVDRLLSRGVPAAPVLRLEELFNDPWLRENGFFQEFDDPQFGPITAVRTYAEWSRSRGGFPRRAPGTGEHSLEILHEFGFDEGQVARLLEGGVVALLG